MIRRPPRSTQSRSSAASDVYKRQSLYCLLGAFLMVGSFGQDWPKENTVADRTFYVDAHNKLRNTFASKGVPEVSGGVTAADMKELKFYEPAEAASLAWVRAKVMAHSEANSKYRAKFLQYDCGENIFTFMTATNIRSAPTMWNEAIQAWYDEYKIWRKDPRNSVTKYYFLPATGHFTQMIWADTKLVGCGAHTHYAAPWYIHRIVCQYCPTGNYMYQQVFKIGAPGSNCKAKSKTYKSCLLYTSPSPRDS
eukprot:TRINITY_DN10371_c0_g1_i1.p1 TRINITY_DN10371_c0_g1~~TRINITY_DN10371_c0_g1_i1.p1  ORF type:complete len:251 (-),score=34.97 TRINITY_DN10371_c0_g1_i1:37-789(-)